VSARHGRDAEVCVSFRYSHGCPGVKWVRVPKAPLPECVHRFGRRHDWHRLLQLPLRHLIEMITMEMRQDDEIKRWQLADIYGRIRQPGSMQPIAQRDLLMHVDEGWIREDGEPSIAN
jgi:hypothetical protein